MLPQGFVLLCVLTVVFAQDLHSCTQCIQQNKTWCSEKKTCEESSTKCKTGVTRLLNCPRLPGSAYAYNETFARYYITPIVAGVFADSPEPCLRAQVPHATYYKNVHVKCATEMPDVHCYGYTAWDPVEKAIIIAFEGTSTGFQMTDEILSFFAHKVKFFDNGYLFKYFNDAFFFLWNGGLEQQVRTLKFQYPDYKVYTRVKTFKSWIRGRSLLNRQVNVRPPIQDFDVFASSVETIIAEKITGHSLGASIASITASYLVKWNMWAPENVRLITFGQPRTGDYDFANWHGATFPYAYRVIHHRDPIPHVPPRLGPDNVFHHRYEVWYNNNMAVGQPYTICEEADGDYCSNTVINAESAEHMWYFDRNIGEWGEKGCPLGT